MTVEQREVFIGQFFAVHLLEAVGQQAAIQTDEVLFGQFPDQRGDVLVLYIGVGVELASRGGVLRIAVVHQESQLVTHFAVFKMLLSIKDIRFGYFVVAFTHKRRFDLILNLFNRHAVFDLYMSEDGCQVFIRRETADREEGLGHSILDLVDRKKFFFSITFRDKCIHLFLYYDSVCKICSSLYILPPENLQILISCITAGLLTCSGRRAFPLRR